MPEIKIKTSDDRVLTITAKDGLPGAAGKDGLNGVDGKNGDNGLQGIQGEQGIPGINGKDGRDGVDGKDGEKGDKGEPGKDGKDVPEDLVVKLKKTIKDSESNLLWVNNNAVKSVVAGTNVTVDNADPQNPIVSATGGISGSGTANQLTYWVNSTTLGSLTTATYPSLTELSYVKGVTSSIQTQLNSKLSAAIISLNGLTGATQTFSGSGISISSVGTTHTFTNTGVTYLNSPIGTLSFSNPTGAVDAEVNQAATFNWTGVHTFTNDIDFTPTDSTSIFFDMNVDTGASVPSRLRFLNNGGIMSSLEINVDQGKDIRYLLPKDQPSTGQILYVVDWTDPIATLGFTSASGDVVGPASALNEEMVVFDGDGQHIKGVTTATNVTIGANSILYPATNAIAFDGSVGSYNAHFGSSTNGVNGIEVYNRSSGTSKRTEIIVKSASTTGGDVWGTMTAYPSNYTNASLASRFEIKAGTSQQMVFEVDSNFEWRKSGTAVAKLTTTGFYAGNGSAHSTLQSGGSFATPIVAKTANYTLTATDSGVVCTSNTFNITFPTAASIEGREYEVKNTGTGIITLLTTSSQTIDGIASGVLTLVQGDSIKVKAYNGNYVITGGIYSKGHLSMLSTATQTIVSAGTPQLVTFNTTVKADKIAVTSSSRFTVNEAGEYLVTIMAQVTDTAAANKTLDIWARKSGTDVANSNVKTFITSTNDRLTTSMSMIIDMTAGQYLELWANGDSTTLSLLANAAGTTPTRPVTPSIFLTVQKIHPY